MNSVNIRPALNSEFSEIHKLICLLEETEIPADLFASVFTKNLNDTTIFYFVSEENKRITGFISIHIQHLLHHWGKVAEIQELCVYPEYRNNGTGNLLLKKAINIARENDCELIELAASRRREKAHRFYLKNGFNNSHFKFTMPLK